MTHTFRFYKSHELHGLTDAELQHLALVDRCLSSTALDVDDLEAMTDDALRSLLGITSAPLVQTRAPAPPVPPKPPARSRLPADHSLPRYRAVLWVNGHTVHLGYFMTEQVRDEVVAAAKLRRSIGLPVKL